MEEITLKVKNMQCESCTKIIAMDLCDNGFTDKLLSVDLTDPENRIGVVRFKNLDSTEVVKAKDIIQKAGKYVVLD